MPQYGEAETYGVCPVEVHAKAHGGKRQSTCDNFQQFLSQSDSNEAGVKDQNSDASDGPGERLE